MAWNSFLVNWKESFMKVGKWRQNTMNEMKKMPQEFKENPLRRGLKWNSLSFRRLFLFCRLKSLVRLLFVGDLGDDDGWFNFLLSLVDESFKLTFKEPKNSWSLFAGLNIKLLPIDPANLQILTEHMLVK